MHAKLGWSCITLHCRTIVELSIASPVDYRFIASTFFKAARETGVEFDPKPLSQSKKNLSQFIMQRDTTPFQSLA